MAITTNAGQTNQMLSTADLINVGLGYTSENNAGMIPDIGSGGNLGILGSKVFLQDAATPMVFPPAIFVVLQTPLMYAGSRFATTRRLMRALMQEHAKEITGIDVEYDMDTAETPAGHDSQMLGTPTRNKRNAITPSMVIPEINGNFVWRFFTKWGFNILDPDSQSAFNHLNEEGDSIPPFVSSSYSIAAAVIQPDPSFLPKNIVDGAFITDMFPTNTGALGLQRTIGTSNTMDRTINFRGVLRHSMHTKDMLVELATQLNLANIRSTSGHMTPDSDDMSVYLRESGIADELANAAS